MCEDADQDIDDMNIMPGTLFVCPAGIAGQASFGENLCPARTYARHALKKKRNVSLCLQILALPPDLQQNIANEVPALLMAVYVLGDWSKQHRQHTFRANLK